MNNNFFSNKRNFKKIAIAIIGISVLIAVFSNIKFQSVNRYKTQQQSMVDEYNLSNEKQSDNVADNLEIIKSSAEEVDKDNIIIGSDSSQIQTVENPTINISSEKTVGDNPSNNSILGVESNNMNISGSQETAIVGGEDNPTSNNIENVTCYIEIRCDSISNNIGKWTNSIKDKTIVPINGVILGKVTIIVASNSTVFDVLKKVAAINNISIEASQGYIKSINQLEQLDAGRGSGWLYWVNNVSPSVVCSSYLIKNGDNIKWQYTCEYGNEFDKNGNLK